jgi:uncharacterized membrane protein (DUF485 family)
MDEFDEMMKSLGISESEEPEERKPSSYDTGDVGADDLDAQLEAMLQADQEASDNYEPMEAKPLVNARSIYDAGGIIEESAPGTLVYSKDDGPSAFGRKKGKRRSLLAGLTVRKMLVYNFYVLLISVGLYFIAGLINTAIAEQRNIVAAMAHYIPISLPPTNVANNANFIMIHEKHSLGEQDFSLSHISPGYLGTYFYFMEDFNPDDYAILLYDQERRLYVRQSFDLRHNPALGTVLRFDPLHFDTSFLTLYIQDLRTREYVEFNYRIIGPITFGAPIFINQPMALLPGGDPRNGLRISHAEFSNIESAIYYSFTGRFSGVGLRQRDQSENTSVFLRDNIGGIAVLTEPHATSIFPDRDAFIGRATFGPLVSMGCQVSLSFRDLYYVYPYPPVDIPLRHLSGRDQDDPHVIHLDPFFLNLEAIAQQGHLLILVLHGADNTGYRLPTVVTASLEIDIGRGQTITIPAEQVNVSPIGTDVVFNLIHHIGTLRNVHIDRYTLILHSVEFSVPEVSVTIDLAQAVQQPSNRRRTAVMAIEAAFNSRLSYMSGEIGLHSIVGFDWDLLHSEAMADFAPRSLNERPMYGATVVAGDFYDNYTFLAVVESEWAVGSGRDLQFIRTRHQVIARSHEGIWAVVNDKRMGNEVDG